MGVSCNMSLSARDFVSAGEKILWQGADIGFDAGERYEVILTNQKMIMYNGEYVDRELVAIPYTAILKVTGYTDERVAIQTDEHLAFDGFDGHAQYRQFLQVLVSQIGTKQ